MSIALDGQKLFDEQQFEIEAGSVNRASIDRSVAGLEGVLSIDLGGRGRKIRQSGLLRAQSREKMQQRLEKISNCMDGKSHVLAIDNDEVFENLRMDVFKAGRQRAEGGGVCCDYEIVYTQLKV